MLNVTIQQSTLGYKVSLSNGKEFEIDANGFSVYVQRKKEIEHISQDSFLQKQSL